MIILSIQDQQNPGKIQEMMLRPEAMVGKECSIGRSSACNLRLESQEVSRTHAKIIYAGHGCYAVCDLGSSGGSVLNGQVLVAQQQYALNAGDVLILGRFTVTIVQIGDPEEKTLAKSPPEPAEFMPVYAVKPGSFPRWQKGDLTVRCAAIINEAPTAKTFRFVADPPVLFNYKPGQFVTLNLEIDGEEVLRSYSISSTPSRPHTLEITVKRVPAERADLSPGLVSNWLHDNLRVGSEIKISGPLGKFSCWQYPSPKLLLISGGSGITPMMSMSRWICDTAANCDVVFLHSAKNPADIIYHQELMMLAARHQNFQPLITVTSWQSGQGWLGLRGRITADLLKSLVPDFMERRIFVCGPGAFMEATKAIANQLGFPPEQYHEESFGGAKKAKSSRASLAPFSISSSGGALRQILQGAVASLEPKPVKKPTKTSAKAAALPAKASGIVVTFQKSNQQVSGDGSTSILEMAEEKGVKIRSSCRAGVCGTCKKKKLSGNIRMDDFDEEALEPTEQEKGYVLACVSFPIDAVVIDA
jgi:glycine betaine catabolism B